MKALVFTGPGAAEIADLAEPRLGRRDVLVRMRAVGLCHSDLGLLGGDYILPFTFPVIPGHEWTGEVAEVGADVTAFRPGDRVVGECAVSDTQHFGFTMDGAAAEYLKAAETWLHRLPDGCDDTMGALTEPFTVGYAATAGTDASHTVAVLGAGPIGLCAIAAAAARGARVVAVEPDPARRELATRLGAESGLDPRAGAAGLAGLTGGRGADTVIEASGSPAAMADALALAAFGGQVVYVGIKVGARADAPLGLIVERALRIRGQVGSAGVWPAALRFLGRTGLDLRPLVSRRFPLTDAVQAVAAAERRDENIKVQIHA